MRLRDVVSRRGINHRHRWKEQRGIVELRAQSILFMALFAVATGVGGAAMIVGALLTLGAR